MNVIDRIKSLFSRPKRANTPARDYTDSGSEPVESGPVNVRRFNAAETHRLNSAHWANAVGSHINSDLATDLDTLTARCTFEAQNNPIVDGVIRTHSIDLVTPSGPTLKVESSSEEFNSALESEWNRWFASPEISGEISGCDLLKRWNAQLWKKGDIVALFVNDPQQSRSEVQLRILDIDPSRLRTPSEFVGNENVALGVRRTKQGKPTQYYIEDATQFSQYWQTTGEFETYSTDDVLHAFESTEPGQVRGYPRLSHCLEEIAQLRDYDSEVLDAARAAANNGMLATNKTPEAMTETNLPTSSVSLERGVVKWLPPGWELGQMVPHQPIAQYSQFRHEKLRALGRTVHMPLLLILLSAEESNFSQSRIDVNVFYERGLRSQRFWIESQLLKPMFDRFYAEARMVRRNGRLVIPAAPENFSLRWHWEPMPQADEEKHFKAKKLKRELKLSSVESDLAEMGIGLDEHLDALARVNDAFKEAGISPEVSSEANTQTQNDNEGSENAEQNATK